MVSRVLIGLHDPRVRGAVIDALGGAPYDIALNADEMRLLAERTIYDRIYCDANLGMPGSREVAAGVVTTYRRLPSSTRFYCFSETPEARDHARRLGIPVASLGEVANEILNFCR